MNTKWLSRWKAHRTEIERYPTTQDKGIAFAFGLQYLPEGPVTVVDVGCGFSNFAAQVQVKNCRAVTHCLDGNAETVAALLKRGYNAEMYRAPDKLPFKDGQVGFVHCSHLIEHLHAQELYMMLQEFDRVLSVQGVIVVSAPTLREEFYTDLSHVRPYPPAILDNYLTDTVENASSTRKRMKHFRREALFYRYQKSPVYSKLGLRADPWMLDLIILGLKKVATTMGIYRLATTGYTAVFRKVQVECSPTGVST